MHPVQPVSKTSSAFIMQAVACLVDTGQLSSNVIGQVMHSFPSFELFESDNFSELLTRAGKPGIWLWIGKDGGSSL